MGIAPNIFLANILQLNGAKVIELDKDTSEFIGRNAPRLWLLGIASSLALNLYKLQDILEKRQIRLRQVIGRGAVLNLAEQFSSLDRYEAGSLIVHD